MSEDARWLTACYVDVDGYRAAAATDGPGSIANLIRAFRSGLIPIPSWMVESGRGAWAFWALLDERNPAEGMTRIGSAWHQPDTACRASRYSLALHHAVNSALAERLRGIGADTVSDAARMVRVFGSINSKSETRVIVLPILTDEGVMQGYTLGELASWLKVPLQRGRPPKAIGAGAAVLTEAQQQQRLTAMRARCAKVYRALGTLAQLRGGGFEGGHRNLGVHYLALHGHLAGLPAADVEAQAQAIAERCAGYGADEFGALQVKALLRNAKRKASRPRVPPRYATLIAALGIGADEQARIGLTVPTQPAQGAKQRERHAALEGIRARLGYTPSCRVMASMLATAGHPVSHAIVALDYQRLGIMPEGRDGRPPGPRLPLS